MAGVTTRNTRHMHTGNTVTLGMLELIREKIGEGQIFPKNENSSDTLFNPCPLYTLCMLCTNKYALPTLQLMEPFEQSWSLVTDDLPQLSLKRSYAYTVAARKLKLWLNVSHVSTS